MHDLELWFGFRCYVKNRPLKGKDKETSWEAPGISEWEKVVAKGMRLECLDIGHIEDLAGRVCWQIGQRIC